MEEILREAFTKHGVKLHLKKGELFRQSNEVPGNKYVYWLEDGICALTGMTKSGEAWTYLYFRAKRLIAFSKLIVSRQEMPDKPALHLIAQTACTVYRLTDDIFIRLFTTNPSFSFLMLQTLADNYDELLIHFHLNREESAAARLCRLLLSTSAPCRSKRTVPKFFTYGELAAYLGIHTVTVSRIMAELRKRGCISKSGHVIVIEDENELQKIIEGNSCLNY